MTCTVIKEKDSVTFVCPRGRKAELTAEDQRKIDEYIVSLAKELETTCDICGKPIVGIENFIDAGDKVVCSEQCLQKAIGEFTRWQNTESLAVNSKEFKE